MKKNAIKLILCVLIVPVANTFMLAQSLQYGLPGMRNFTHFEYAGGMQTWAFTESKNGLLYFANNNGLLEFDGSHWVTYNSIPAINRSVYADGNRVYVGAFNEFGYYEENVRGILTYHSLSDLVKITKGDLGEIWRIHKTDFGIVFTSSKALFIYKDGKIATVYPRMSFNPSYFANDILWMYDDEQGLMEYRAGKIKKAPRGDFFIGNKICSILSLNEDEILIATTNNGVFRYNGLEVVPWISKINENLRKYELYSAIRLKNNCFAFGTIQNGLYITDLYGNEIFSINKERGLQNNTILGLGQDSNSNIWLCLDNGISVIEFETPISYLDNYFDLGTGYVAARYGDKIYFGTNQGLYYAKWTDFRNPSKSKNSFRLVNGTTGQVWSLKIIDNVLFCGHDNGIYQIQGNSSIKISNDRGVWNFLRVKNKGVILAGTYRGLLILKKNGKLWRVRNKLTGFSESSRFIEIDYSGNIWVGHPYKGIYRLLPDSALNKATEVRLYNSKNGLPSDKSNFLYQIRNEIIVATLKGIYKFNSADKHFEKSSFYEPYIKNNQQVEYLYQDSSKNIWFNADRKLGVLQPQKDGTFKNVVTPFSKVSKLLVPTFIHVNEISQNDILIGIEGGFVHYITMFNKVHSLPCNVFINDLRSRDTSEGVYRYTNSHFVQSVIPGFKYSNNAISISYSSNNFESSGKDFRYKLIGFDEDWSPWTSFKFKEYTNLPAGQYTFVVQALNNDRLSPSGISFKFSILSPWYLTWYALVLCGIVVMLFLYFVQRYLKYRFEKARIAEVQKHKEKTLLAEKEMIHLRNEKLHLEVIHKEKELANSTMQLIKRNESLNKLKTDLLHTVSTHEESVSAAKVKNLIKRIDKDIDNEKQWKVFNLHVELVYENLFTKLKAQYPDLTPRELSLCAYLRMNISSKEIASLMNISYRGVEISRYRIRKKLKLSHDANLTEFMLKL